MSNPAAPESAPYATIGFTLKQAQHALRTRMDADLRGIGLTTPQYAVLACLKIEPGASNASLARHAFVTPQTMQAILVTLEKAGLITRSPHPEHGRVRRTEMTVEGLRALEAATDIVADAETRLRKAAAPLDYQAVTALLLRLTDALR
ncbi:MarR family winged helix-turn-helix transcriptional regulator [Rhizorhabdus dicambivorans]|uniref:MarR family transcriptional regulator n=1 Tax=Rhizorhabdus dicambivorans TaxID=1850238 RepID=A0A2A4FUA1_9SPHN|nr:MarR family transcriptional regulator [Rhizorhabdus dicambivorans]ATE64390.1 MarR family transcriptional regulator [Rhizorhabdus dicambivorans]PCE41262.1 MarR family transcriptional regulator [Rhizorhabdus dicambivorans]